MAIASDKIRPHPDPGQQLDIPQPRSEKQLIYACQFCKNSFGRLEHLQSHERTHTKDKPFKCRCGKGFSRRGLLTRHTKLVYDGINNEIRSPKSRGPITASKTSNFRRKTRALLIDPDLLHGLNDNDVSHIAEDLLDLGTPTGGQLQAPTFSLPDSSFQMIQVLMSDEDGSNASSTRIASTDAAHMLGQVFQNTSHAASNIHQDFEGESSFHGNGSNHFMDGFNEFFDFSADDLFMSLDMSENDFNASAPEPNRIAFTETDISNSTASQPVADYVPSQDQSRSCLPRKKNSPRIWSISTEEFTLIKNRINEFAGVLLDSFSIPSRYTLSRYVESYISRFHAHVPLIQPPTFQASSAAPELLLAIVAIGAQQIFEQKNSEQLWCASKAICLEHKRIRHAMIAPSGPEDFQSFQFQTASISPASLND